eukprot:917066-Pelagomonas_calceolata.AAC.4
MGQWDECKTHHRQLWAHVNLQITDSNRHLLGSGYTRRRPEELAVLSRWFKAKDVEVPEAAYLDLILYSREQLVKGAAFPKASYSENKHPSQKDITPTS